MVRGSRGDRLDYVVVDLLILVAVAVVVVVSNPAIGQINNGTTLETMYFWHLCFRYQQLPHRTSWYCGKKSPRRGDGDGLLVIT
jgi:hypothetical protein